MRSSNQTVPRRSTYRLVRPSQVRAACLIGLLLLPLAACARQVPPSPATVITAWAQGCPRVALPSVGPQSPVAFWRGAGELLIVTVDGVPRLASAVTWDVGEVHVTTHAYRPSAPRAEGAIGNVYTSVLKRPPGIDPAHFHVTIDGQAAPATPIPMDAPWLGTQPKPAPMPTE